MFMLWIFRLSALVGLALVQTECPAQRLSDVARMLADPSCIDAPVACTGTVDFIVTPDKYYFTVSDGSASALFNINQGKFPFAVKPGDRVALCGRVGNTDPASVYCETATIIERTSSPNPTLVTINEILDGLHPYRHVCVRGQWEDVFIDEIDPRWIYGILTDGFNRLFVTIERRWTKFSDFSNLIGGTIEIDGMAISDQKSGRHEFGYCLRTVGMENIKVIIPPPSNPFDVPDITALRSKRPDKIATLPRHRTSGLVLAVWDSSQAVLQTKEEAIVGIRFADNPPNVGQTIEAVGLPETDFFNINLVRAIWRPCPVPVSQKNSAEDVSISSLTTDDAGHVRFKSSYHGRLVRLQGIVRSMPSSAPSTDVLILEGEDGHAIRINTSACPSALETLDIGAKIRVTGVCVMETETDRINAVIPRVRDILVVARSPGDFTVLSSPPWWTPNRTLLSIAILLAALIGVFIWNRQLHNLAERRGKELASEHLARAETDMKVMERTRLAIELHDTIAQNLTGVAYEIDAATRLGMHALPEPCRHLAIASNTLESCRSELRNCLWDLRCNALEEKDMDSAIRQTLLPYVDGVDVFIRFNVPREIFSENTAHAVLCIVRELVVNAIRHGAASHVWIAGSIEHGNLLFSVRDNGTGFDPEKSPGVLEGHFGLNGIKERLKVFSGNLMIERLPQTGMKLTAIINLPRKEAESD